MVYPNSYISVLPLGTCSDCSLGLPRSPRLCSSHTSPTVLLPGPVHLLPPQLVVPGKVYSVRLVGESLLIPTQVVQNQIMQQMMSGGNAAQGPTPGNGQLPSEMTQQFNETANVPNNRVDQRERNQYRQPST